MSPINRPLFGMTLIRRSSVAPTDALNDREITTADGSSSAFLEGTKLGVHQIETPPDEKVAEVTPGEIASES